MTVNKLLGIFVAVPILLAGCQQRTEVAAKLVSTSTPQATETTIPRNTSTPTPEPIQVDSNLTLSEALKGKKFPRSIRDDLVLVDVQHLGYDGKKHQGQLIVHRDVADDVRAIFSDLLAENFPIEKIIPVNKYDWSDGDSMAANNTSAFNYRIVRGRGGLSQHALGRAIDINPLYNPCIRDGMTFPRGSTWDASVLGTITEGPVVEAFTKRGWRWGGHWRQTNITDYQHFEKLAIGVSPRFY